MAISVTLPQSATTTTKVSSTSPSSRVSKIVTSQSLTQTSTTFGGLTGVDVTGVQDGYTLVYDSSTGNWEAQPAAEIQGSITNLDGGTF